MLTIFEIVAIGLFTRQVSNVLMHQLALRATLNIFIETPLRLRLEAPTPIWDREITVHAKIFFKMMYVDPAMPNHTFPSGMRCTVFGFLMAISHILRADFY